MSVENLYVYNIGFRSNTSFLWLFTRLPSLTITSANTTTWSRKINPIGKALVKKAFLVSGSTTRSTNTKWVL